MHSPELSLAFTRLCHSCKNEDPAPTPQLALPLSVIEDVMTHEGASSDPKDGALADSVALAFFFLLRVGEHAPSGARAARTTQIRRKDMQFWRNRPSGLMDRISPLATPADLLEADAATKTPDNQKNGQWDAALHHNALPNNPMCPCKAPARPFIRGHLCAPTSANAILSLHAPNKHISATQMAGVTRVAALRSVVWLQGCDLLRIGPLSLRASGAMQLKLNGESDSMIQKMGRWSSNTWLQCVHGQISCLASGMSARMAAPEMCFNVGTRAENLFQGPRFPGHDACQMRAIVLKLPLLFQLARSAGCFLFSRSCSKTVASIAGYPPTKHRHPQLGSIHWVHQSDQGMCDYEQDKK
jgi:hypothetical protein